MATAAIMTGEVESFDDPAGLGVLRSDEGRELPFHCTAIADGSRSIAEGTRVAFVVVPGPGGRWEASRIMAV